MVKRFVLLAPLVVFGCVPYASKDPSPGGAPPEETQPAPTPGPTTPTAPSTTASPTVSAATTTQKVFDWTRDRCETLDTPSVPASVVRAPAGGVVLAAGGAPRSYVSTGASLDTLTRRCASPALVSASAPAFGASRYQWLAALYRDQEGIHALVHDELLAPWVQGCAFDAPSPSGPCSYSVVASARSVDGLSFSQVETVAPFPIAWQEPATAVPTEGYVGPSSVVKHTDGLYYAAFGRVDANGSAAGTCIMHTTDLASATSWRAHSGPHQYDLALSATTNTSPTEGASAPPALCAPVSPAEIGSLHDSLRFSSFFGRYILVGAGQRVDPTDGRSKCGAWFSLSSDLETWDPARLLLEGDCGSDGSASDAIQFPSLVDPTDTSLSFENVGATPYLYYATPSTAADAKAANGRDLVRVALTFGWSS